MLLALDDVSRANIDDRASDTLRRLNDNVVVFRHVESIQRLDLLADPVQHTLIDGVRHAVVDELGQYEAVFARIEHLECVKWERKKMANIRVSGKHRVDVGGEGCPLVFVDGVL